MVQFIVIWLVMNTILYSTVYVVLREDFTDIECLQFDFATIEAATNRFSDENKIGQGGFGVVYKVINLLVQNG
jgi:hypothetical protein